jgi:hypothetical protein
MSGTLDRRRRQNISHLAYFSKTTRLRATVKSRQYLGRDVAGVVALDERSSVQVRVRPLAERADVLVVAPKT